MKRRRRIVSVATLVATLLALITVTAALAHPLGNFTVNRFAGLVIQRSAIDVDYVVDMAEIPAYQEISQQIGETREGAPDESKTSDYRARKCAEVLPNITLALNQRPLLLATTATALEFPPGAGGLLTLRLTCGFHANVANLAASNEVTFQDSNFQDRIGWREIVVQGAGVTLLDSSAPSSSISERLKSYPNNLLSSPPNQTKAKVHFDLTETRADANANTLSNNGNVLDRTQDTFAALITPNDLSLPFILFALFLAMGLGALHAVSPGHGKTIIAAYLVGTRGTLGQAVLLGMTVTLTHTAGVLALGVITLFASRYILPESLYPWLSLISGLLVIAMGAALIVNRWRELRTTHDHAPIDARHHHHGDILQRDHSHLPADLRNGLSWKSLVGLGLAGGLVPSTSALILLLSAISLQRIPFGIVLIVAFGIGMALVLVGIGLLLVRASSWLERRRAPQRLIGWLPVISAVIVVGAGILVSAQAYSQLGHLKP
jgi:nickel/cobalt exporter